MSPKWKASIVMAGVLAWIGLFVASCFVPDPLAMILALLGVAPVVIFSFVLVWFGLVDEFER